MAGFSSTNSVPNETVIRVARLFGIEVQAVTQVGGGFSGATVYRVDSQDGQPYAIRSTPLSVCLPELRTRALHRLLRAVSSDGVSVVPVPIQPAWSRIISLREPDAIQLDESWVQLDSNHWQAEPWKAGAPVGPEMTGEHLQSALHCLHLFHESAARAGAAIGPNKWFFLTSYVSPGLMRRLQIAAELSGGLLQSLKTSATADPDPQFRALALRIGESLAAWLPWLLNRLTQLSEQPFTLQPVIRDVWRAHVLFTGNEVTGLIDFNAAATDHVCLDLSRLFRSWFGSDVQKIRDAARQFSLLRPFSHIERTLLEVFDASTVLLSPVTWLRRRFESDDRTPCRPEILLRLSELTQVAEQFQPL